jgi:hypothetical protein
MRQLLEASLSNALSFSLPAKWELLETSGTISGINSPARLF